MAKVTAEQPWWRSAIFYQIYPRSFADGNGDGAGDLIGIRERLDYLVELGVDALWLSPFYRSPMTDGGYDVADPCDVDPMFGTLADFDALVAAAHERRIRVTIDIVPNHFSDQHVWFTQALASAPGSPERARFIFRDGRGEHGELPPNNWPSAFGGPAWRRVPDPASRPTDAGLSAGLPTAPPAGQAPAGGEPAPPQPETGGQWYLHLFTPEQPDLNWDNPEVPAEFERILRFWLDRGVDGFRVDVAHGMAKPAGLPDMDLSLLTARDAGPMPSPDDPRWDGDELHEYLRIFRRVLDSYPGDRMAVGEAWVPDDERLAHYVRPDELNLTFNFRLLQAAWDAEAFHTAIDDSLAAMAKVGAPCTWVLSNHDVVRHVTRYGGGAIGAARGRAATLIQLSLPGAVYVYNGDELGLPNVDLPDAALQDPTWERSGHTDRGRDGERVPLPWSGSSPPYGFTTGPSTWLPMPPDWAALSVEAQSAEPDSTLALYQAALALRRKTPELRTGDFAWLSAPDGSVAYRRGQGFLAAVNTSDLPAPMPPGEVLLASGPLTDSVLPANTAVWLRT
jgi:alpha-glucosidase